MKPIVHGLEDRYGDQINFIYLDIDDPDTDALKQALRYRYQPHYILLDDEGTIIQSWVGAVDEATFVAAFDQLLD